MNTEWRAVVGFEGVYEVSNTGNVRRVGPDTLGRLRCVGRILRPHRTRGYLSATLFRTGRSKGHFVHRLVAAAFLGPIPAGHQVNHKNGIKTDNSVANLEYMTPVQNRRHALHVLGRKVASGPTHWRSKLSTEDIQLAKRLVEEGQSHAAVGRLFDVKQSCISRIVSGERRSGG
jgi:hypothetical protein